ncbi:glycosyltransferase family 4 protein [Pseudonocardia sp. TMWB2A]|uniref:glycosyltransferase n=1 Tax=Pseudonocardia sp. TMWB2A TaxID=687430 RepID=UPI00307DDD7C
MRVALAHDYLAQRGGAERVTLELCKAFPDAPLFTSVYQPDQTFAGFADVDVRTSWLQKVPGLRSDPRLALPLLPFVWDRKSAEQFDVVLASSSGWAHGVDVGAAAKVVYCHNPARWLYQADDYFSSERVARLFHRGSSGLRRWDRRQAATATTYVANSSVVQQRIQDQYGLSSELLFPPVSPHLADGPAQAPSGVQPGFWLTVARGRGYKNVELIRAAFDTMPDQRLVVVGGRADEGTGAAGNITALGVVAEPELRWLYRHACALVTVAHEDFGLTPVEANSCGTPALALRAGGHLDTVREGVSGWWIEQESIDCIRESVESFVDIDPSVVAAHAEGFSVGNFATRLESIVQNAARSAV